MTKARPRVPVQILELAQILWQRGMCPACGQRLRASKEEPVKWRGKELVHKECA